MMVEPRSVTSLAASLYIDRPDRPLYHYTSIGPVLKIIAKGMLYATDVRYMTDASELLIFLENMRAAMLMEPPRDPLTTELQVQLTRFLNTRLSELGHSLFVACFTQNGSLLSQWRSYCEPGKGISIGFDQEKLADVARSQGFMVGRCVYEPDQQQRIARQVLSTLERQAIETSGGAPERLIHKLLSAAEIDLLKIAVLFKDFGFREEDEWRAVSGVISNYHDAPIQFREGRSMITPYLEFHLPSAPDRRIDLEMVFLGPTPHPNSAMASMTKFLSKYGASPRKALMPSNIRYRTT